MKPISLFLLLGFVLHHSLVLSQTTFGPEQIIVSDSTSAKGANGVCTADFDSDGDQDIVASSYYGNKITWYENMDGNGTFSMQKIITQELSLPSSVRIADIDGDGNMDILSASWSENKIVWHKNIDGTGIFGPQQIVNISEAPGSVFASDLDQDGDIDILSTSYQEDEVLWHENIDGNGNFGSPQMIDYQNGAISAYVSDLDGDEDKDILVTSLNDNKICWYENTDGNGTFILKQIISTATTNPRSIISTDIDSDGDQDVVSCTSFDMIFWFENLDGLGTFGSLQIISLSVDLVGSLHSSDIDNDGDFDLLVAEKYDIRWYENTDGLGNFGPEQLITSNVSRGKSVYTSDLNNDGNLDVISASGFDDKIAWYENIDGNCTFGTQNVVAFSVAYPKYLNNVDIDVDGDPDVLFASGKIFWFENDIASGIFGPVHVVGNFEFEAKALFVGDIDCDDDLDIVSACGTYDTNMYGRINWYENLDGYGNFSPQQTISFHAWGVNSICPADIDCDGDLDILSSSISFLSWHSRIVWYENLDGNGNFGYNQTIIPLDTGFRFVYTSDLDIDGDQDMIAVSNYGDKLCWYENIDCNGTFGNQQIITTEIDNVKSIHISDIDNDGDQDLLSASQDDNKIAWYENTDGNGTFGPQQILGIADGASWVSTSDLTGNGYPDVLFASANDNTIAWFEHLNGSGTFSEKQTINTNANEAFSVIDADIDCDGDNDVLSTSISYYDNKIAWYSNLTIVGIEQQKMETFIYPNPTHNYVQILTSEKSNLIIYDISGRMVMNCKTTENNTRIDLSSLDSGIYIISVMGENILSNYKIIKK